MKISKIDEKTSLLSQKSASKGPSIRSIRMKLKFVLKAERKMFFIPIRQDKDQIKMTEEN